MRSSSTSWAPAVWTALLLLAALVAHRGLNGELPQPVPTAWLVAWTLAGILFSHVGASPAQSFSATLISCGTSAVFASAWWPVATPAQRGLLVGLMGGQAICAGLWYRYFGSRSLPILLRSPIRPARTDLLSEVEDPPIADLPSEPNTLPADPRPVGGNVASTMEPLINKDLADNPVIAAPAVVAAAAVDFSHAAEPSDIGWPLQDTPASDAATISDAELSSDAEAVQWLLRRVEDGVEVCEGQLLVEFAADVREVALHVAFCPPLPAVPHVELDDVDGRGWTLQTTAAYPYGLRLTVRRSGRALGAETGRLAYWAQAVRQSRPAA